MSSELRTVLESALDEPLVEARPVEDVMRRGRRIVTRQRIRRAGVRFVLLVLMTTFGLRAVVFDGSDNRVRVTGGPEPHVSTTTTTAAPIPFHEKVPPAAAPPAASLRRSPPSPAAARPSAAAAGEPERCTRTGRAAAGVRIGVDIDFVYGARAAADRVNRTGGVCGRLIDLAVGPAADAVARVSPYGASAPAIARITAAHAHRDLGARTFAVVYEARHQAAAEAYRDYVGTLTGAELRAVQPVQGGLDAAIAAVHEACADGCDAVLLALAPSTLTQWLRAGGALAQRETAALPDVLTPEWPQECTRDVGDRCRDIAVWTPYKLPGASLGNPDLDEYARDARLYGHDPVDAAFQAGYVGMRRLAAAMEHVGPNLTEKRLRAVLDAKTYTSGLVGPGDSARELRLKVEHGRVLGWRDVSEAWERDPGA